MTASNPERDNVEKKFEVGDRVVFVPPIAKVLDTTQEDLRKVHTVTRIENNIENTRSERVWIDSGTEPQSPMYYQRV